MPRGCSTCATTSTAGPSAGSRAPPGQEICRTLPAPFVGNLVSGSAGDLLIGEAIRAQMICELSPRGCLPDTMSVGAMVNVLGRYPDRICAPAGNGLALLEGS